MTKKHFVKFAEYIRCITDDKQRADTAELVADVCRCFNENFTRERFMLVCGVNENSNCPAH
jgi:hypothetical protein